MAKVYGDRWQILSSLASGGQAEVFKVRDIRGEYSDELILKRVRNPKRHSRFKAEVEAIKRLDHPNIIRLIDHSALFSDGTVPDQQFIVMPFAGYGDLSSRVALYKNNPDSVVQVAKSLALALRAAHEAGIVHRDVKPENVLFPNVAHDVWLSDFGICLIRDERRGTPADEVVGPVQFMAPELEGGGQLSVTPAADIYSLGKVIYYMLSGGIVLPRERLHDSEYGAIFQVGERQRLFETLLSRMICTLRSRIDSIEEVLSHLARIESWERAALLLPIQSNTLTAIEEMKRKALDSQRQAELKADIRNRRDALVAATCSGVCVWFNAELEKIAPLFEDGRFISAGVRQAEIGYNEGRSLKNFTANSAIELWVINKSQSYRLEHIMRFSMCTEIKYTSFFSDSNSLGKSSPEEQEHSNLMLVPSYGQRLHRDISYSSDWQFFTVEGHLRRPPSNLPAANREMGDEEMLHQQSVDVMALPFSTENWPSIASAFPEILQRAAQAFVTAMTGDAT